MDPTPQAPNALHRNPDADLGFLVEIAITGAETDGFLSDVTINGRGNTLVEYAKIMVEEPIRGLIYTGIDDAEGTFGYSIDKGASLIPVVVDLASLGDSFRCQMHLNLDGLKGAGGDDSRLAVDSVASYGADLFTDFIGGIHYIPPGVVFKHNISQSLKQVIIQNSRTDGQEENHDPELLVMCVSNDDRLFFAAYNPKEIPNARRTDFEPKDLFSLYSSSYKLPEGAKSFSFERYIDKDSTKPVDLNLGTIASSLRSLYLCSMEADFYSNKGLYREASATLDRWLEELNEKRSTLGSQFSSQTMGAMIMLDHRITRLRNTYASIALFEEAGVRPEVLEWHKEMLEKKVMEIPRFLKRTYSSLGLKFDEPASNLEYAFNSLNHWQKGRPALPEGCSFIEIEQYTD
ncbi:MAG: hypothetical protein KKE20_05880 [Nanoarchaeota archaeon]|nr:hypothetical protein [Nanoarchaeota archaeon]